MLNFNSIKFKIVVIGVALFAAGLGARIYVVIPFVREQVAELVAAQELTTASLVADAVDRNIQSRLALIGHFAADLPSDLIEHPEALQAWIDARQHINPTFDALLVASPEGRDLFAGHPAIPGLDSRDRADPDWFREAGKSGKPVLGKPVRAGISGIPLITVAAPVRDPAGRVVAALCGVSLLNAPGFLDSLRTTSLGAGGGFMLVAPADKMIVASSDPATVLAAAPSAGEFPLFDRAMSGFRGSGMAVNAKGVEEMSAIAAIPTAGWFVLAHMPTDEAFRPLTVFRAFTLQSALVVLLAMIVLTAAFLSIMLRPLVQVARAMHDIADGKRELAPLPVRRKDEVGDLVLGFNHLVAKLGEKETALHNAMLRLDQLASTDELTGAWNRRQFNEVVDRELDRSRRYGYPISLMVLDLDQFKRINDNHGHAEGDRVLHHVAECIRRTLRKTDSLTRWGGEEFVVLMSDTGLSSAIVLAERVRASVASSSIEGLGSVTASIGVAEFLTSESCDQWVARADAAMYRAKRAGRNRVEADATSAPPPAEPKEAGFAQLVWGDQFRSGNQTVDFQHRALFDDINKVFAAMLSWRSGDEVDAAIERLMRNMNSHFRDEERILLAIGYPDAAAHRAMHAELSDSAVDLVERFRGGGLNIGELFQFLARDVVANHILSGDRDYFPYLNAPPG